MAQDKRYNAIKSMMESGHISSFKEIFEIVPKTMVSKEMGMNYQTFTRKVNAAELFTLKELQAMAKLFDIPGEMLVGRIFADLAAKSATSSRKKAK